MTLDQPNKKTSKDTGTYRLRPSQIPPAVAAYSPIDADDALMPTESTPVATGDILAQLAAFHRERPIASTLRATETRKLKRAR